MFVDNKILKQSSIDRNERRKAGESVRMLSPVDEDAPSIMDNKSKLTGSWESTSSFEDTTSRMVLQSLPRYGKNALSWEISNGQAVSSPLIRSVKNDTFKEHINLDFIRQAGLPFTLNQRVTFHGVFSEMLYRHEDQTSFITILLSPCRVDQFADGQWLRRMYADFLLKLEDIMASHPHAKFHLQGFTEACIHTVSPDDVGSKGSYLRSFMSENHEAIDALTEWVVPHVHILATAFDHIGVWPTVKWRKALTTDFYLSNQLRCQNLGTVKRFNDGVGKHARRVVTYAKKTKPDLSDIDKALSYIVQDQLPNNGWFEFEYGRDYNPDCQHSKKFFENRDYILDKRMPRGFLGFRDNIKLLIARTQLCSKNRTLSYRAVSLVLNSGAPEAGTSVHRIHLSNRKVLNKLDYSRSWRDLRCKICLSDDCGCLLDNHILFNRIQRRGYWDEWYDDTFFEKQRELGNFMSAQQNQGMFNSNGVCRPHWPKYLEEYQGVVKFA